MNQFTTIKNLILETYAFSKTTYDDWSNFTCFLKHNEEYGELSEALLVELGQIKHKELKEPVFGEIIDNLIMCIHYYSRNESYHFSLNNHFESSFKDFIHAMFSSKDKISLIKRQFLDYTNSKNLVIPLESSRFEFEKTTESLNNIFLHLINLAIVLYSIKFPETSKDELLDKTLEELSFHFKKKLNKWKSIEEKR